MEADQEVSQFPTLEEIEQISNEKALAAHGNRPRPATNNPVWKNENVQSDDEAVENEIDENKV